MIGTKAYLNFVLKDSRKLSRHPYIGRIVRSLW